MHGIRKNNGRCLENVNLKSGISQVVAEYQQEIQTRYNFFNECVQHDFAFPFIRMEQKEATKIPNYTYIIAEPEKKYFKKYRTKKVTHYTNISEEGMEFVLDQQGMKIGTINAQEQQDRNTFASPYNPDYTSMYKQLLF